MPQYRQSLEAIKAIPVATPDGVQVPLRDLANIPLRSGASYIYREHNARYLPSSLASAAVTSGAQ